MKKVAFCVQVLIAGLVIIYSSSFGIPANDPATVALDSVTRQYHQQLDQFAEQIVQYQYTATQYFEGKADESSLQKAHLLTRLAFKKVEYFLEYFDRLAVKKHLNGAPLPAVEPNVPEVVVIEPSGLQVLDELIFAGSLAEEETAILQQIETLRHKASKILNYQRNITLHHRHVYEASRQQLYRIFTLGVTGFDTPGSVNAIPEANASLGSIKNLLLPYQAMIDKLELTAGTDLFAQFDAAITYLVENPDFESFNRLTFYQEFLQPLSAQILEVQLALGIETINEVDPLPQPYHYEATQLFADDFFNPDYYLGFDLSEKEDLRKQLGQLLFFDPVLSSNNKRACASCHQADRAFTDGLEKSLGIDEGHQLLRNSPTLINSFIGERYFYDLREPTLERQIKHVVMDDQEFATDFLTITAKLHESPEYVALFQAAYPEVGLSTYSISNALAVYVANLHSFNSPFDRLIRGEQVDLLEEEVEHGFNLFMGKAACGTCHFAPSFSGIVPPFYQESESEVLGVPFDTSGTYLDPDLGRVNSGRPVDEAYFYYFSFKTPSIRNVELTAPYMHNGVYGSLEEVMNFYNEGGGAGLGLNLPHQTLPPEPLELNEQEIADLITFMKTLTDTTGMNNQPSALPLFPDHPEWNNRSIGGSY